MSKSCPFLVSAVVCVTALINDGIAADEDQPPDNITVLRELRYRDGASPHWKLDLAMPKGDGVALRPAIVVIHGGGWIEGDKSSFSTWQNRPPGNIFDFATLGIVAVTINYRLSTEAQFPAALYDCQAAVRWLRAHAAEYRIDSNAIGAWGNSAGGHLALLLGMVDTTSDLPGEGPHQELSSRVQAVVSDSGPIDLLHQYQHQQIPSVIERLLGGPLDDSRASRYALASPIHHISPQTPPMLLIYGEADTQVGVETADRFVAALQAAGRNDVGYIRLGKAGHCPHSLLRVPWLVPAVNEFFVRTLQAQR